MAQPGFYNANSLRAYPLVADPAPALTLDGQPVALPTDAILDFGCVLHVDDWDEAQDVYLASISRQGDVFSFEFHATSASLSGLRLAFIRHLYDTEFTLEFVDADAIPGGPPVVPHPSHSATGRPCDTEVLWEGFLVTGALDALAAILASGQSLVATYPAAPVVEPGCVQDLGQWRVLSLSVANALPTAVPGQVGCPPPAAQPHVHGDYVVAAYCLTGDFTLREGYNCQVDQDTGRNRLVVGAYAGAGEGQPCAPVLPGGFTDTGTPCYDLIRSINGLAAANFRLAAGHGTRIVPDPLDPHGLVVQFDTRSYGTCDASGNDSLTVSLGVR